MPLLMPALNEAHHRVLTTMWYMDEVFAFNPDTPPAVVTATMDFLVDMLVSAAPAPLPRPRRTRRDAAGVVMTGHEVPLAFGGDGVR